MTTPVLLVVPQGAPAPPLEHLSSASCPVHRAHTVGEVGPALLMHPNIRVVVSAAKLADGSWLNVLSEVARASVRAELVVLARHVDPDSRLLAISCGAFDALSEGFEAVALWDAVQRAAQHAERFPYELTSESAGEVQAWR